MSCAWALAKVHDVVLFEKESYLGGHSRTLDLTISGKSVPVDTGFIVFNRPNYPNLLALFEYLKVPYVKSAMSFGVSFGKGDFEYGTGGIRSFLGQFSNLIKPRFWRMFFDIVRFNRFAKQRLQPSMTLGQLLDEMRLGEDFRDSYLLPMAASIWSTPRELMLNYPAETFLRFFDNHGLLTLFDQPQWYTVQGGSREYVSRLMNDFPGKVCLSANIKQIRRSDQGVEIQFSEADDEEFDRIIFACHADQARKLMTDIDNKEEEVLKCLRFQANKVVTHCDTRFMPKRRQCWSSWVYLDPASTSNNQLGVSLSYWMNNLQPLEVETPVFVTLNPDIEDKPLEIMDEWETEHPLFDQPTIDAQQELVELQGYRNTYYCGAWTGYGFHEDGLKSGLNVAESLGAQIPWRSYA